MRIKLPPPAHWQDFEDLCLTLWRKIWRDPNAQKNGNSGQSQNGVDIFGQPYNANGAYHGIQCKRYDKKLTERSIREEITSATLFTPTLNNWTLATTVKRDAAIQELFRNINSSGVIPFPVNVWSWDDISDEIQERPDLCSQYIGNSIVTNLNVLEATIEADSSLERVASYFSRAPVSQLLPPSLRLALPQVILEIAQNAFVHGRATRLHLTTKDGGFTLHDDGSFFNPLDLKQPSVYKNLGRGVGLRLLASLLSSSPNALRANWKKGDRLENELCFTWEPINDDATLRIVADQTVLRSRGHAFNYGSKIVVPQNVNTIIVDCRTGIPFMSGLHQLASTLISSLPEDGTLVFLVSTDFHFADFLKRIDARIAVISG